MKIFISYSSKDRSIAEQVYWALVKEGYAVFFDKDSLSVSGDYNKNIRYAISNSDLLIFLISRYSVDGSYALTELKYFQEDNRNPENKVLPVRLDDVEINKIPAYLKAVTILEAEGNIASEIIFEVRRLGKNRRRSMRLVAVLLCFGVGLYFLGDYVLNNLLVSCPVSLAHNINENLDLKIVKIESASFEAGDADEKTGSVPVIVDIKGMEVDKYKVTNKQYANFIEKSGYKPVGEWKRLYDVYETNNKDFHPAVNLTWLDAKKYCEFFNKRLPSEYEWEYLCRTKERYYYPWGNGFKKNMANVDGLCGSTTIVGAFDYLVKNESFVVSDIFGNVKEWTGSVDRSGDSIIVKGSSYKEEINQYNNCISKAFFPADEQVGLDDLGFRCVRDLN